MKIKNLKFWWSQVCWLFLLWLMFFCVIFKKSLSNSRSLRFSMFSSRSFIVYLLYLGLSSFPLSFYMYCEIRIKVLPFPKHCLFKWLSFSHWIALTPLLKINWPYMCGSFSKVFILFHFSICLCLCQYHILLMYLYKISSNQVV